MNEIDKWKKLKYYVGKDAKTVEFKGTYAYSLTHGIFGDYTISVEGDSFTVTVSDDHIPESISYKE